MITITIHDNADVNIRIRRLRDEISGLEDNRVLIMQTRQRTSDSIVEARRFGHHAEAAALLELLSYYAEKELIFNDKISAKVRKLRELLRGE